MAGTRQTEATRQRDLQYCPVQIRPDDLANYELRVIRLPLPIPRSPEMQ